MTKNIPRIEYLEMIPQENRQEVLDWISSQPEALVDDQPDRLSRWEIRIVLGGFDNLYIIHDRATKETKVLKPNIDKQ